MGFLERLANFVDLHDSSKLWVLFVVCIFCVSWVITEIFLFIAIRIANRFSLHDNPDDDRKIHEKPIPTIGGIPIYFSFVVSLLFSQAFLAFMMKMYLHDESWTDKEGGKIVLLLVGSGVCMLLGLLDDIKPISAVVKLIVLFVITTSIFILSDIKVNLTPWPVLNLLISLFWIVGMMSAINSLDNMDGLAAGITAIACIFFFLIAWAHWDRWLCYMAVVLCASCLTFLKYNFFQSKAGVFLGDNGSYFIGFILAYMAMMGAWTSPRVEIPFEDRFLKALMVPSLLLGIPIFDIIVATILRKVNGVVKSVKEAIVYCGTDHVSHRLVVLGFSRRQAVLILWGLAFVLGTISLVIQGSQSARLYIPLYLVTLLLLIGLTLILNRAKVYQHQSESPPKPSSKELPSY